MTQRIKNQRTKKHFFVLDQKRVKKIQRYNENN